MKRAHECEGCGRFDRRTTRLDDNGGWWHARCADQQGMDTYIPRPAAPQPIVIAPPITDAGCWRDGCSNSAAPGRGFCTDHLGAS